MPLFPPFIGGTSIGQSSVVSNQRTVNFYPEHAPKGKVPQALYPTPGVRTLVDTGLGVGRTMFYQRGRIFAVIGASLVEFTRAGSTWSSTTRGTVADDVNHTPATITANGDGGDALVIVASGVTYGYDLTTNTLTDLGVAGALTCGMLDGFIWALDSQSTIHATPLHSTTFDSSQVRDMAPDPWLAGVTVRREIVLIGEHTLEIWYNAGTSPFPFAPHPSGGVGIGIAAKHSLAAIGDGCMWLAQTKDGIGDVYLMQGGQPTNVADHDFHVAVEGYLEAGLTIDDAVADVYEERGHTFYVLTFPTARATWVFDLATGLWHERGRWSSPEGRYDAWRPMWHVFADQTHLWLDREAGILYQSLTSLTADTDGLTIRRLRRGPHFWLDNKPIVFSQFELLVEPGLGLAVAEGDEGYDPLVELLYSDDDGKTWISAGARSMGRRGQYATEVIWNRLGSSTRRQFEVVTNAAVPVRLLGADITARMGGRS